jgi:hypothetical protein
MILMVVTNHTNHIEHMEDVNMKEPTEADLMARMRDCWPLITDGMAKDDFFAASAVAIQDLYRRHAQPSPVSAPGEILELFKGGYLSAAEATDALERVFFYPASAPAQCAPMRAALQAFIKAYGSQDSFTDGLDKARALAVSALSSTDGCARCGLPKSEHHYNGAAYGVCGDYT